MSLSRSQFAITMQTKGIKGGRPYLPYVYTDPIEGIVRKVVEEDVPALRIPRRTPVGELLAKYEDPCSAKMFSHDDYKMYPLNRIRTMGCPGV